MRVYRVGIQTMSNGLTLSWHSSRRKAERYACEWLRENGDADNASLQDIRPVDIPTDREGLLHWLNIHFDTDNG